MRSPSPIIVLGGGIGGLSAAIRLAAASQPVILLEKNSQLGGKMGRFQADGFTWDTGPSVITMRQVFVDLFAAANRRLDDYLTLRPLDPLTRYFYPDGLMLDASQNLTQMAEQIARLDERDVEGYLAFLSYAARLHRITGPVFIYDQPPTWRSFLRVPFPDWFKVDGLRTMDQAIGRFVHSPHLRQLLGRFATYVGASPYLAPATLNVIAHVELTGGVWYPQGGVYQIAAALTQLAQELGVEIRTNCPVAEILVTTTGKRPQVTGVRLTNGGQIAARQVISNLDVTATYQQLLPTLPTRPPPEPSCSGFIMLLGVKQQHPQLAHHNIFFSRDYPAEFAAIFRQGVPPTDPTIYVAITSKSDPDHAPPGSENWFVLVNAPPTGPEFAWPKEKETYRDLVLDRLAGWGYELRPHLISQHVFTPEDLAQMTGAWRGALYGSSSNNRWAAFLRPPNRAGNIQGLYFAGGTTHPGGGVPMVTLSGRIAAEMVMGENPHNTRT